MIELTETNHGAYANPHPQYQNNFTISSLTDNDTSGKPWIKIFDIKIAQPDLHLPITFQRVIFGFKAFDTASDNNNSIIDFGGYITIRADGNLYVSTAKTYSLNPIQKIGDLDLYVYYYKNSDSSFSVKGYVNMSFKYKRLTLLEPFAYIPQGRISFTRQSLLTSKVPQYEKTKEFFKYVNGSSFITENEKNSDISGYSFKKNDVNNYNYFIQEVTFSSGVTASVQRISDRVFLEIYAGSTKATGTAIGTIPLGFRPQIQSSVLLYDSDGKTYPALIKTDGTITTYQAILSGVYLKGHADYRTVDEKI